MMRWAYDELGLGLDEGLADGLGVAVVVSVGHALGDTVGVGWASGTASQYHRDSPGNQHWCGSGVRNSR